jgi:pectate lyase
MSRSQEMPSSVKSLSGGNTYNNFDLNSSVMYSYTADEPATAKTNVMKYAGRVNGGDFKWTFDNSKDDAAYAVNKSLKDALVAYKGTVASIQGEGNLPVVNPTSSSSSAKSSSSSAKSSSGTAKSSSSVQPHEDPVDVDDALLPIDKDMVHNFTEDATSSDYIEFVGSLSTTKGTVSYEGLALTRCLKMETSTNISFSLAKKATVTLVFNSDFEKNVKVDGSKVQASAGFVKVDLAAGSHAITKGDVANLFLIVVDVDENSTEESSSSVVSSSSAVENQSSSSEEIVENSSSSLEISSDSESTTSIVESAGHLHAFRYVSREARLEIYAEGVRRLEIFTANGNVVKMAAGAMSQGSVDLSSLKPGVYVVRLVTPGHVYQQVIVKK